MASQHFPRLSSSLAEIDDLYDVIVIGSGYGGSIAASRCARAGQKVCLLERGKEWLPGEFPESFTDAATKTQITKQGQKDIMGDPTNLFEFVVSRDITVLQGCGLGGGSLINASVGLEVDHRVLAQPEWPEEIRKDSANLTKVDKLHVEEMLRPQVYPDSYPPLSKMAAIKDAAKKTQKCKVEIEDIEDISSMVIKTPLYVNFDGSKDNHVGIRQPACNGCGNCCSGCNTGAKNTLNMNYIPDAVAHGAKVFTQVEVTAVLRDPYSTLWSVHYCRKIPTGGFELAEQRVRCKYVILGAGALGSSKILMKSKARGLDISDRVGHRFTGNGDVIGYCYNSKQELNGVGMETGMYDKVHSWSPGPTITSAVDLRKVEGVDVKEGVILEDGTSPSLLEMPYAVTMAITSGLIGVNQVDSGKMWSKLYRKLEGKGMTGTLAFLGMSHDDSEGHIQLDPKTGHATINWAGVGRQKNFEKVNEKMTRLANNMGGMFVKNPMWTQLMGKEVISAHPLGGCAMGETGKEGVVNHRGQVFIGDSMEVYPDLLVMDGSIMPTSLGVNPTMTICMLAERCCRLLAEEAGWKIDYKLDKHLDEKAFVKSSPGLRFTERMAGALSFTGHNGAVDKESPCEFTATIETQDLDQMLHHDINHSASLDGTVTCPALSADPMQILPGSRFELFKKSQDIVDAKEMCYNMDLRSVDGKTYHFKGVKIIKKDHLGETGLKDTTALFVKVYDTKCEDQPLAMGVLCIHFQDFMRQLNTMEILNVKSDLEKLKWKAKFSAFFGQVLFDTYSGLQKSTLYDPSAPPRQKRPLKLDNVIPEVFMVETEDKVQLKLTRYNGGSKGPLMLSHGMAMAAQCYTLDTIPENPVEFFVKNKFDVWLFDWRGSIDLPWVCYDQYTIDDVGYYDFPAAVDKVLEITKEKDVQILVHCVSSISLFSSLLSGRLRGKVRCVIASQVSATPVGSWYNKVKSKLRVPGFLKNVAHVDHVTAYTDSTNGVGGRLFNNFTNFVADAITKRDEKCGNHVCHRLTAVYGLLYEHENLNNTTHDVLHELFGSGSQSLFQHLALLFRKKRLVKANGQDSYLPGIKKKRTADAKPYLDNISHLNIPILFFRGEKNSVFHRQSHLKTKELLTEQYPNQHYEFFEMKEYGHLDGLLGKHASVDVYPHLLAFLDKYSEDHIVHNVDVVSKFVSVAEKLKAFNRLTRASPKSNPSCHEHLAGDSTDFALSRVPDLVLDTVLTDENVTKWKRKKGVRSLFQKEPSYFPPEKSTHHDVMVEEISLPDQTIKRDIVVMSDLHLGTSWSTHIEGRLRDFCETFKKTAKPFCHTLVLLGDILDLWHIPIGSSPPSSAELLACWGKNKTITYFADFVKEISDQVNVYYLTGNHDHNVNEGAVYALFGDKIKFVRGTLIYVINNGFIKYRIRFEHGHNYDLFNSYSIVPDDFPSQGYPFGYYVTRSVASSAENYMNDSEEIMEQILNFVLSSISSSLFGSAIVDLLGHTKIGQCINESLIERALDRDVSSEDTVVVDRHDRGVSLQALVDYPLVREVAKKVGSTCTFSMLKASLGDWDDFLQQCHEDVVVLGHSHKWKNRRLKGRAGHLHYLNSGTFIDYAKYISFAKINPPTSTSDGVLEVCFQPTGLTPISKERSFQM